MKRLMSILLASVLLLALTACGGGNESSGSGSSVGRRNLPDLSQLPENSEEDFQVTYSEYLGGAVIQEYKGSGTYVKIPQVIKLQPVVGIASGAFRNNVEGVLFLTGSTSTKPLTNAVVFAPLCG